MRPFNLAALPLAFALGIAGISGVSFAQTKAPANVQSAPNGQAAPNAGPVDPDEPLPPDHPTGNAPGPHGGSGGGGNPNVFEPPPDTAEEDERLGAGSIAITILDADNKPVPSTNVTLGILHNSVAKGESREHKNATTNEVGAVTFDKLTTGSGIAYRVSVAQDGATFAASPFALPLGRGIRIGLHIYPVTHDLNQALVVMQAILYAEMKDDRVQIQQVLTVYNFGRTAWVPSETMIGLPADFTALNGTQEMSDTGIDPIDKKGARLKGTFGPGRHDVEFRWQLPYSGTSEVEITEALPPHIAVARVISAASDKMRLVVTGFPDAESHTDPQGQHVLVTERQMRREDAPLTSLHIELRDIPTQGPGAKIATGISSLFVFAGIGIGIAQRRAPAKSGAKKSEGKAARAELLTDLEELERAHASGEIGPKTYERARRELIDALARSLASTTSTKSPKETSATT